MGFPSAWFPSGQRGILEHSRRLLEATQRLRLGTSILNIHTEPEAVGVAESFHEIDQAFPARFLLGLGVGHPEVVDRGAPGLYGSPLRALNAYLDGVDAAPHPVPREKRAIAALGPKMLELAARRSAGALPYLTLPDHTREARALLGPDALLAVELMVVLERDPEIARRVARQRLAGYLGMSNYLNSFRRQGFDESDLAEGGRDSLIDALVTWGGEAEVRRRVDEHLEAGADHVAIQVLTTDESFPVEDWKRLAPVLI